MCRKYGPGFPGTTGDGVDVDPNYRGKGLQLYFTVDDANVFTALVGNNHA